MFSLFGQLCRLKEEDNVLAKQAMNVFSSASPSTRSWFWKVRQLCLQCGLPHPASWLSSKPSKLQMKTLTKSAVLNTLRSQADTLSSLQYLQTKFLGLTRCHPLFRSCGSSPWEVEKATTQARLMSGRYMLESLTKHWVPWNREGLCSLPDCWGSSDSHEGTIECFLFSCPSLSSARTALADYKTCFLKSNPDLVALVERGGDGILFALFKLTRNVCHCLHKARMSIIGDE